MEGIKTKEINISNINDLLNLLKKTLDECKDTQFFISNKFYNRIIQNNTHNLIWEESVIDSFIYSDTIEKAFIFSMNSEPENIQFQLHFVKNCVDYMHLTFFASKGFLYQQYLSGLKQILIITTD